MKIIKQSRYLYIISLISCIVLSFFLCLLSFNIFSGDIAKISGIECLCSFLASLGVDILFAIAYWERFEKLLIYVYEDKLSYCGKTINFNDILDLDIDSTLNKNVKRVYINTASEQFILILNGQGFTELVELLPTIKTKAESVETIKIDGKQATDTLMVKCLNAMFYITFGLGILIAVVLTFKTSGGGDLIAPNRKEYVIISACVIWVVVLLIQILSFFVTKLRYNHYTANFYDDNVVIVFGNKIINNREILKSNVNAIRVTQTLVGRLAGKYRLKLITDSIGGGTNEFDYFPYLLSEEQKDMILQQFFGKDTDEIKIKRSSLKSNMEILLSAAIGFALVLTLSIIYNWVILATLIPIVYLVLMAIANKGYALKGNLLVVGYGVNPNLVYVKTDRIESCNFEVNLIQKATKSQFVTIYLYGYKEQILLGCFEDKLFDCISSKLKK